MITEQMPLPIWRETPLAPTNIVGDYFVQKYRDRAARVGVQAVARQLRKQGVDVEIAALILAVRS
jgi:hypothetical protein